MDFQTIQTADEGGGVYTLTLYRPEKRNAISIRMREEISTCLAQWATSDDVRVVIFTGSGPSFSSGFDLKEFEQKEKHEAIAQTSMTYHRDVWNFPKPTIAAVNGFAMGGGLDLAVFCDVRLCSQKALFGHPEIKFGGHPLHTPLRWIVGEGLSRDLCLTGRIVNAAEALRIGLVSEVLPPEGLMARALEFARMMTEAPAQTLEQVKHYMNACTGEGFEGAFKIEHDEWFARRFLKE